MGKIKNIIFPAFVLAVCVLFPFSIDRRESDAVHAQTGIESKDDAAGRVPAERDKLPPAKEPEKEKLPEMSDGIKKYNPTVEEPAKKAAVAEKARRAKTDPPQTEVKGAPPGDGVLLIDDGPYRYARIPGYKAPDKAGEPAGADEKKESDVHGKAGSDTPPDARGLFGLSRKSTDLMAKGVLAGVILLIVVLYRMRTKSRRSSVLKRFPRA